MSDVHSKEKRSFNMSMIKGKNTKPEMVVRKFLHANGFRFRIHDKRLPGSPDIVLPRYKTVIFISGCFWHGHESCRYFILPKTRTEWWAEKINNTVKRDIKAREALKKDKWKVLEIWECELKKAAIGETLIRLTEAILNSSHGTNALNVLLTNPVV